MASFLQKHRYSSIVLAYAASPFVFEAIYERLDANKVKEEIDVADVDVLGDNAPQEGVKARIRLARGEGKRPDVAYPTLLLAAVSLGMWGSNFFRYERSNKQLGDKLKAVLVGSIAAFMSFTPLHDATHYAISKYRWLNELVGNLAGLPFCSPLLFFRYVHLMHHRHTNDHDGNLDPDNWAGRGPGKSNLFHSAVTARLTPFCRENAAFSLGNGVCILYLLGSQDVEKRWKSRNESAGEESIQGKASYSRWLQLYARCGPWCC